MQKESVAIGVAGEADLPTIRRIALRTWPVTFRSILSPAQIDYMLDWLYTEASLHGQLHRQGHTFLLARAGGEPLGFASCEPNYQGTDKTKLHKLYVLPEAHGHGVGRALVDAVTEIAQGHGNAALRLNVNRQNVAIRFYRRLGFEVITEENIPIGNGFLMEDYVMEKVIGV
ncbi:MAG: GNAT family N-acetyltransferase [Cytophagales bacterium]|nr:GNAT family N-acetyltransferase [Cytophagales bacterium]